MTEAWLLFLYGGITTLSLIAGVFFLRYYRLERDRLFLFFAVAFWCLGASWGLRASEVPSEHDPIIYGLRLAASALIIAAIFDKNRPRRD